MIVEYTNQEERSSILSTYLTDYVLVLEENHIDGNRLVFVSKEEYSIQNSMPSLEERLMSIESALNEVLLGGA